MLPPPPSPPIKHKNRTPSPYSTPALNATSPAAATTSTAVATTAVGPRDPSAETAAVAAAVAAAAAAVAAAAAAIPILPTVSTPKTIPLYRTQLQHNSNTAASGATTPCRRDSALIPRTRTLPSGGKPPPGSTKSPTSLPPRVNTIIALTNNSNSGSGESPTTQYLTISP